MRSQRFGRRPGKLATAMAVAMAAILVMHIAARADENTVPSASEIVEQTTTQSDSQEVPAPKPEKAEQKKTELPAELLKLTQSATALNPEKTVMLDLKGGRLIVKTEVACRNCILEMLCVPEGIKEHETILRVKTKAYVIHTGLVALGAEPGRPARFSPQFEPPSGTKLSIYAAWVDEDGKLQRKDVRDWVRHNIHRYYSAPLSSPPPGLKLPYKELRWDKFNNEILWYGPLSDTDRDDLLSKWDNVKFQDAIRSFHADSKSRRMEADFVFAGSQFYTDPETNLRTYQAEGGYLICVANFGDSMIDVREESSASDGAQAYEAWTEHIPAENTPVLLEIVPAK